MGIIADRRFLYLALAVVILLLAAGARFYNLGGQSLWYDEGVAYGHSQRTPDEINPRLRNNVHVPAYFVSLAYWEDLAGSTEFALRMYSALWGILSVAATYALGKRLFSPLTALTAAAFVALNSFSVYYAQEARMYAMLAAVAALSMIAFVVLVRRAEADASWRDLLIPAAALALLNTLGAHTHVSYALVMLTQGMMALLWLGAFILQPHGDTASLTYLQRLRQPRFWRFLAMYVALNVVTILLFAPWLTVIAGQVAAQPNISEAIPLMETIGVILGWMAFGVTYVESAGGLMAAVLFLLIFAFLTVPGARGRGWWALLLPVVWVVLSVSLYTGLELYTRYLRFLLPAQIGFALWLSRGIWSLWHILPREGDSPRARLSRIVPKVAAVVSAIALCLALLRGLPPLYHAEAYQRDDYRGMMEAITASADENDAIIVSAPGLQEIVGYYNESELPVYPLPMDEDITAETRAIIDQHDVIYAVFYGADEQDPDGFVRSTLARDAYPIGGEWVGDVRLERYAAPQELTVTETPDAAFGDAITLTRTALNDTQFASGDTLLLELEWRTSESLSERYKVFVQLLDADGALVTQRDSEPLDGLLPTTLWTSDEPVMDRHALSLENLPAGEYTLIAGLYSTTAPYDRLPVADSDFLRVAEIEIVER